ncbi:Npun_F0494 family protein [Gloeocapsa sp. BRSZ]
MSIAESNSPKKVLYPRKTVERAKVALACSPFQRHLFETMCYQSVSTNAISNVSGTQQGYTKRPLSELAVENALMWLIQVGVLRREVDGQGITDSFRLTPLGRQLVEETQESWNPTRRDRLSNMLNRWLRLPF